MEFVYVQVNGTHEYEHDSLNTTTVVALQVLFHYEILYMKWATNVRKQVKESQSRVVPSLCPGGGRGVTSNHFLL